MLIPQEIKASKDKIKLNFNKPLKFSQMLAQVEIVFRYNQSQMFQ